MLLNIQQPFPKLENTILVPASPESVNVQPGSKINTRQMRVKTVKMCLFRQRLEARERSNYVSVEYLKTNLVVCCHRNKTHVQQRFIFVNITLVLCAECCENEYAVPNATETANVGHQKHCLARQQGSRAD